MADTTEIKNHVSQKRPVLAKSLMDSSEPEPSSRVLVIYTGGTIGMKTNDNGVYEPKEDFLVNKLRTLPMFHDREYANTHFAGDEEDFLVMPPREFMGVRSSHQKGRRVMYKIMEYKPLLDSSNMMMTDWGHIATDLFEHYDQFDGFVVLHGTDTMAYTASALSFMCENLGKTIILTGSQIPIFEVRSDGRDNFLSSLIMAGLYNIPEVLVCFDNKILRGSRTIKNDAGSFSAFISPNLPPIATLEIRIHVDWSAVFRATGTEKFRVHTNMCQNVGLLRMFPGITTQTVRAFLQPPMQGVVLQTYGAGNAPDNRPDLLNVLKEASNIGVVIINITQCTKGCVMTSYATGKALEDAGVICGGDMTPEAALTKLSYVLSKETWTLDKKRKFMKRNLRGEMTVVAKENITILDFELIESVARALSVSSTEEIKKLRDALYPSLMCAAAQTGDNQALEKLRTLGGNLSSHNHDGRTALHVACREGHVTTVQYLLHQGASVHLKDSNGITPLQDAVIGKHHSIIRLLVKTGALLTIKPIVLAMELCCAAATEEIETLQAYRAAGANMNECDYDKRTPLHVAVDTGSKRSVHFLLDSGVSWMFEDMFGNTALDCARKRNATEIIEMIEQKERQLAANGENGT
ncbi:L-asparaginase-like isoform X2 [Crassostrea angulata]|uniref:L-asparaginase-like isoform X2 n=1 Tax=Magallana angulata TaxID=2784310 RepID=UPI0022B0C577|nr:L-asparaginase-like isoform X2 [Crassostrea angulata]